MHPGLFFKLIRWPNLVVISLTQILFYFIIFMRAYQSGITNTDIRLQPILFFGLLFSSLFIAAAGYMINDLMDQEIDRINKPSDVIIGKTMSQATARNLYISFSIAGLIMSALVSWKLANPYILLFNFIALLLLFFYSTTLKRKPLSGNLVISTLSAWVILIFPMAELYTPDRQAWSLLLRFATGFGVFAFFMTLIREMVKDLEDIKGDAIAGCHTVPIRWGVQTARKIVFVLGVLLVISLMIMSIYFLLNNREALGVYGILLVVLPLIYLLILLQKAYENKAYHRVSIGLKLVMLTGIFSIFYFLI